MYVINIVITPISWKPGPKCIYYVIILFLKNLLHVTILISLSTPRFMFVWEFLGKTLKESEFMKMGNLVSHACEKILPILLKQNLYTYISLTILYKQPALFDKHAFMTFAKTSININNIYILLIIL